MNTDSKFWKLYFGVIVSFGHQKYSKILVQVFFSCSCSIETYLARAFEFYKSQADKLLQEQQAKIKIPFDGCYK